MFPEYIDNLRASGRRFFTFKQAVNDLKVSVNSVKSGLYRLKLQGKLITPSKGLYIILSPEHRRFGSIPAEELVPILMNYLQADYYVALLSAGLYYGATHQKPGSFHVISNKRIKNKLIFGKVAIDVSYKKTLTGLPTKNFTVKTGYLKVATPELIAFDLLKYQAKSGGLNHIATVLSELVEELDAGKLIELARITGEKAWLQRLGYIVEKIDTMEPEKAITILAAIKGFLRNKMKVFVPIASNMAKSHFPREKKWMIIENTTIESDL